jgi:hypothetical protein
MATNPLLLPQEPYLHLLVCSGSQAMEQLRKLDKTSEMHLVCRTVHGEKAKTTEGLFKEFATALQFPDYFGENWDAFDECITDLEWLPADGYVLLVIASVWLLVEEPNAQRITLFRTLDRAGQEWSKPKGPPSARPPKPFHVLLQCSVSDEGIMRKSLQEASVNFNRL